ncbi:MAG: YARHG domain-containing protein [Cyclobacteriaceae bacterium]
MRPIFILILLTTQLTLFGQYIGFQKIEDEDVKSWTTNELSDYYGAYHFGDSETETTLLIFATENHTIAQIRGGRWNSDFTKWLWNFENFTDFLIYPNGKFLMGFHKAQFSIYTGYGQQMKCLKIHDPWNWMDESKGIYELGTKEEAELSDYFSGNFIEASITELNPANLKTLSSQELKLMRNELFARYGYIFKEGGEMEEHFRKRSWYEPQHTNVDNFLTELEKENIKLIQTEEANRK